MFCHFYVLMFVLFSVCLCVCGVCVPSLISPEGYSKQKTLHHSLNIHNTKIIYVCDMQMSTHNILRVDLLEHCNEHKKRVVDLHADFLGKNVSYRKSGQCAQMHGSSIIKK